jgi:hypothetical protein
VTFIRTIGEIVEIAAYQLFQREEISLPTQLLYRLPGRPAYDTAMQKPEPFTTEVDEFHIHERSLLALPQNMSESEFSAH